MNWIWPNFSPSEFDSPDLDGSGHRMDKSFLDRLQAARKLAGIPFKITSGYRTKEHNKKVGGSISSSHLKGVAADIYCENSGQRFLIVKCLLNAGFKRIGIGDKFIHVDSDKSKLSAIWHYYK